MPEESAAKASADQPKQNLLKRALGHHNAHWWALAITSGLLALLLLTWIIGTWQYKQFKVGDVNLSKSQLSSQLQPTIEDQLKDYRLRVEGLDKNGKVKEYKLAEAGIEVDVAASVAATRSDANYWRNRILWWKPINANLVLKTDTPKLINFVNTKTRIISKQVKNAGLSVNPKGVIVVTKESEGIEKSLGNGQVVIRNAVRQLDSSTLKLTDQVIKPQITSKTIEQSRKQLEDILAKDIVFTIAGNNIKPTPHDIAAWLNITPNKQTNSYNIAIDKNKIADYITGQAANYISLPVNQVEITLPNGTNSVLVAGQNGSNVTNTDTVIETVQKELLSAGSIKQELKVAYTPYEVVRTKAGKRLIEVDVTRKVMYAYENNVLIKTMYISAGAPATPTVLGTYTIYSKLRSQTMSGFNADGSTYIQPNVPYVNYFYRDYAIHGNYWRPASYFGNINSSHGCVGIQDPDAEWIYNWAPIGTPVVVHT